MTSNKHLAALDPDAEWPTATEADNAALRRNVAAPMSPSEYLAFLSQFEFSIEELKNRVGPRGTPFSLFPQDDAG